MIIVICISTSVYNEHKINATEMIEINLKLKKKFSGVAAISLPTYLIHV